MQTCTRLPAEAPAAWKQCFDNPMRQRLHGRFRAPLDEERQSVTAESRLCIHLCVHLQPHLPTSMPALTMPQKDGIHMCANPPPPPREGAYCRHGFVHARHLPLHGALHTLRLLPTTNQSPLPAPEPPLASHQAPPAPSQTATALQSTSMSLNGHRLLNCPRLPSDRWVLPVCCGWGTLSLGWCRHRQGKKVSTTWLRVCTPPPQACIRTAVHRRRMGGYPPWTPPPAPRPPYSTSNVGG